MKSSLRWVSWSEWQELLKDWMYWKQLTQNCDVVVRLRFQSRDTSVSLFSLKVVKRLKEFRKCGEFRSYFFYIKYCIAADSNILRLNIAWHALRIWSQRNFTISVKSISLELPLFTSFLRLMIHSWLLHFFYTLHQNFQQILWALEWKYIQNCTTSDHLPAYHLGPSHNLLSAALL